MPEIERHPFEPFLPTDACVLFLGSFPPQRKRWCMEFYYPNWLNDFWRVCGLVFFGEKDYFVLPGQKRFDLELIKKFCIEKGIALFDTATEVRRLQDNASDKFLEVVTPTDLPALLARIPSCRAIVTTGQKATETILSAYSSPCPSPTSVTTASGIPCPAVPVSFPTPATPASAAPIPFNGSATTRPVKTGGAIPPVGGCTGIVIGGRPMNFYRMPSTSRAYPLSLDKKADVYRQLFTSLGLL